MCGSLCVLVYYEKDLIVCCLLFFNMSKEIVYVFWVKDFVFVVVKIDNEDFFVLNEC